MAIMENMTEAEVKKMQAAFEENIKPKNDSATFDPFRMPSHYIEDLRLLEEKVASLEAQVSELTEYIKLVFGGHGFNPHEKVCPMNESERIKNLEAEVRHLKEVVRQLKALVAELEKAAK